MFAHTCCFLAYSGHRPVSERTRVHSEAEHECAQNCALPGLQSQLELLPPSSAYNTRCTSIPERPPTLYLTVYCITGACSVQFDELLLIVEIRRTAEYHTITVAYYLPEPVLPCICTPTAPTSNNQHIRGCSPQAILTLSSPVSRRLLLLSDTPVHGASASLPHLPQTGTFSFALIRVSADK